MFRSIIVSRVQYFSIREKRKTERHGKEKDKFIRLREGSELSGP